MLPEKRAEIQARHEASHVALAICFGMLGKKDTVLDIQNEVGCTPIVWQIHDLENVNKTKNRATIAMAGIASDFDLRKQEGELDDLVSEQGINWEKFAGRCEESRDDINKTMKFHAILQDLKADKLMIKDLISEHQDLQEDQILDAVTLPNDYQTVDEYYQRLGQDELLP